MGNILDPNDGEPLRDFLSMHQSSRSHSTQREIASLLRQQQRDSAQQKAYIASLPQCPYCGGRLEGEFELCLHCKNSLAWVKGYPCKPGKEDELREQIETWEEEARLLQEIDAELEQEEIEARKETLIGFYAISGLFAVIGLLGFGLYWFINNT